MLSRDIKLMLEYSDDGNLLRGGRFYEPDLAVPASSPSLLQQPLHRNAQVLTDPNHSSQPSLQ